MMVRNTVAYVRTWTDPSAADVQKEMILRYCKDHGIKCSKYYEDIFTGCKYKHTESDANESEIPYDPNFPEWNQLIYRLCSGEVGSILVDTHLRLYRNETMKNAFYSACRVHKTAIVEVGCKNPKGDVSIAVYHYTDESDARPRVVLTAIDRMYSKASQRPDWDISYLLLDMSLRKRQQVNLEKLLTGMIRPGAVYLKSFYHISRNIGAFWKAVTSLEKNGVRVVSEEEGELDLIHDTLPHTELRVVVYDQNRSVLDETHKELRLEKLNVFVRCRTNWKIVGTFLDDYKDLSCPQKEALVDCKGTFDIVLVDSFAVINAHTNQFCRFKTQVGVPIFSLREGGVNWHGD